MMDRELLRKQVAEANMKALCAIKQSEIDALVDAIMAADRVFVAGWGRAGNCIKLLSMNCSQIGRKTHIVGDNSTPSIHEGDLLVIGSGKGTTATMVVLAEQCKQHGAKLALITGGVDSAIEKLSDITVHIPRAVSREDMPNVPTAIGLSFYQVVVMLNDCITSYIMEETGLTFKDIMLHHNNLE